MALISDPSTGKVCFRCISEVLGFLFIAFSSIIVYSLALMMHLILDKVNVGCLMIMIFHTVWLLLFTGFLVSYIFVESFSHLNSK